MSEGRAPRRPFPLYPLLLAVYPIARLYGDNASLLMPRYAVLPAAVALVGAAILGLLFYIFYRDREQAAGAAAATIVLFFTYGLVHRGLTHYSLDHGGALAILTRHRALLAFWAGLYALALFGVGKWLRGRTPQPANFAACVLVGLALAKTIFVGTASKTVTGKLGKPSVAAADSPDIYYIILDGYGRRDVLKRFYRYDNKPFLDDLQRRGFWIAEQGRSNYLETGYSIPSSLNADYLAALTGTEGGAKTEALLADSRVFFRLMEQSRVARELRNLGYQVVNIGSGFSLTNYDRGADLNYGSSLNLTEFNSMLLSTTVLLPFVPSETQMITGDDLLRNLRYLGESSKLRSPKFVFAHVLSPHPPYQFDAAGNPVASPPPGVIMNWENVDGYVGQVRFLNRRVLETVDVILKTSKRRPIIVLQGDHGPSLKDERVDRRWNTEWTPGLQFARSGILNAMLVPDDVRGALYPTISPVNTFRTILRQHFGRPFQRLPDKTYFSTVERPLLFEEVDEKVLRP